MRPLPALSFLTAATIGALSAGSAFACAQYDNVVAAVQGGDAETATVLYEEIAVSAACDDALRDWVGDYLARENFRAAMEDAGTDSERTARLEQALRYERHWRTFNELGVLAWNASDYVSAAENFQLALNELAEGDPEHTAEGYEIATLYDYAWQSLSLAEGPVDIPVTRSGAPGGIFTGKIRGFEVVEVPVPITFEYDSTDFDEAGAHFAKTLADYVLTMNPSSISLVGHTDPRGTEEYNDTLSLARAEAVGTYLKESGFVGDDKVAGLGESQIPEAPPGVAVDSEEHYRIARRVAFTAK